MSNLVQPVWGSGGGGGDGGGSALLPWAAMMVSSCLGSRVVFFP